MVGLGLALCAMGLQACGAAVGQDALYHLRGETDLSSRRLAITRMALIFVSALGYALSVLNIFAPGELVALALSISAACVAPSVILIFWPRAGDREALIALGGGALGMIMALFAAEARRRVDVYALAGLGGATLALAAAAISGLYAPDNPHARSFVKKLFDDRQDAPDADATY
jgi:cation/acetate symporter